MCLFRSRLDAMQAAFLRVKLRHLGAWNDRRRVLAHRYLGTLAGIPGLELPSVPGWCEPVWHLFVIRHARRDDLRGWLKAQGVDTLLHYPIPPHLSQAYADRGWKPGAFPVAEAFAQTCLSLPLSAQLTDPQAEHVISSLKRYFSRSASEKTRTATG